VRFLPVLAVCATSLFAQSPTVRVGSKTFTESVVLGEILTQLVRHAGVEVEHRRALGGTRILWNALVRGEIDLYPEYTGTIGEEILGGRVPMNGLDSALAAFGVGVSRPLGFNNTYAIGMRAPLADSLGIRTISGLQRHPDLVIGFTNEFMDRADGWPSLQRTYGLRPARVFGLDHDVAYRAIASGDIHVTDLYSTDAEIGYYGLRVLEDDRHLFPDYHAVVLYRLALRETAPVVLHAVEQLEGNIDEPAMIRMSAQVKLDRMSEEQVASEYIESRFGLKTQVESGTFWTRLLYNTLDHLWLVLVALSGAIVIAVPLGVWAFRRPKAGAVILSVVGIVQTIPSLALLVFMIPLLGIGFAPAVAALFLYSLLPIVRNAHAGLSDIPPALRESAEALGLSAGARLRKIELPMASRTILAGIKTSAVITVGTATLGALIGAGGYGQPILTGIRLDSVPFILEGAVPAALLAIGVQYLFEWSERWIVPKGLRIKPEA
jgi:osmoprotectant transport system permease protein